MTSKGSAATFSVCMCYKTYLHQRTSKRCKKQLTYAAWGVGGAPVELREMYRKRFGIETRYRHRREARIGTCTRDPKLRLFYVGISLLLRNVWVLLHATLLAEGEAVHPEPCWEKLRYADLLKWLSDYIKTLLAVSFGFRIDYDTGKRLTAEDVT